MSEGRRLVALDGLRGLGALAVMAYHASGRVLPAHGYLAVDLFFMLSGYVLAGAYEARLRDGLALRDFLGQRLARLYPLYFAGVTLGLLVEAPLAGWQALGAWFTNLAFLGRPTSPGGLAFWLDPPMWSLSLEVAVNLLFAALVWRFPNRALALVTTVAGAALTAAVVLRGNADFGWEHDALRLGLGDARVMFSFPLGWLAWRLRGLDAFRATSRTSVLAVAAVAASLVMRSGVLSDLIAVLVVFPLAVTALAQGPQPGGLPGRALSMAGELSYPLYATQAFSLWLAARLLSHAGPLAQLLGATALAILVAWIAHRTIEPIGRRMLTRLFAGFAARPPVASASATAL